MMETRRATRSFTVSSMSSDTPVEQYVSGQRSSDVSVHSMLDSSPQHRPPELKRKPVAYPSLATSEGTKENFITEVATPASRYAIHRCPEREAPASPHTWILETFMVVFSISGLVAASVLLLVYDDKPLSSWSFFLSFNTVISILGAASRASLAFAIGSCISQGKWNWLKDKGGKIMDLERFEEASRGPWGSVRLLWWTKFKHQAAIGAICTVILLGFEPFLQAGITFYGRMTPDRLTVSTIGAAQRLDVGMVSFGRARQSFTKELPEPWGFLKVLEMDVQYDIAPLIAMSNGLTSHRGDISLFRPEFTCTTGNCTWEPHASLATCSKCTDISSHLKKSTGRALVTHPVITMPYWPEGSDILHDHKYSYTKYKLDALGLNISNFDSGQGLGGATKYMNAYVTARATTSPGETISFQSLKTLILSFGIMETSHGFRNGTEKWQHAKVTAHECALYFCTNVYQAEVSQGELHERLLESYAERNLDSYVALADYDTDKFKAYNELNNYTLDFSANGGDKPRSDLQLIIPSSSSFAATVVNEQHLKFNISQNATTSVASLLLRQFAKRPFPMGEHQLIYPASIVNDDNQPPVILGLGVSRDIKETFEYIGLAMTKWMRYQTKGSSPHEGKVLHWVIYIRVQWPFVALPVAVTLGSCIFCLFSVIETRRLGLPAWKGSILAILAHGLDLDGRERLRASALRSQMDTHARRTEVQLMSSSFLGPELVEKDARIGRAETTYEERNSPG